MSSKINIIDGSHKIDMATIFIYITIIGFWLDKAAGFQLERLLGLGMGLSLQNVCLYFLMFTWAITLRYRENFIQPTNINRYLIIIMFVAAISIIPNLFGYGIKKTSLVKEIVYYKGVISPWLFFILITTLITTQKNCIRAIWGIIILLIVTVLAVFIQNITGIDLNTQNEAGAYIGRSAGFSETNQYAAFLVLFIPIFLSFSFLYIEQIKRIIGFFLLFIGLAGLAFTVSKGGFISFFISLLYFFITAYKSKIIGIGRVLIVMSSIVIIASVTYIILPAQTKEVAVDRVTLKEKENPWAIKKKSWMNRLTSGRTELWARSLKLIAERPFIGYGNAATETQVELSTHSDPLKWAINYGIIGFLLFVFLYYNIYKHILYNFKNTKVWRSKILYLSYLSGFIGYVTAMCGVNIGPLRTIFWIYTAIIYKYSLLDTGVEE